MRQSIPVSTISFPAYQFLYEAILPGQEEHSFGQLKS